MSSLSFLGMKNKELHRLVLQQQKSQESTPSVSVLCCLRKATGQSILQNKTS